MGRIASCGGQIGLTWSAGRRSCIVLLRIIISPCLIVRLHDGKSVKNEQPRCSRWKARQWRWKVDKIEASWETRQVLGRTARADAISSP
jgi:hypothetical protein